MVPYKTHRQNTGHRGELYSRRLKNTSGTSFFFNLKENREGDIYLNIVESFQQKDTDPSKEPVFERHSILIFAEQRDDFVRNCLAALEALDEGQHFDGHIESSQRDFHLQTSKKRGDLHLILSEKSQHYDRLLHQQIQIPQSSAPFFSKALIEIIEKWLQCEKESEKKSMRTAQAKKHPPKKKVVALKQRDAE